MLLQRLYDLSTRLEQDEHSGFAPTMYAPEALRWFIELDATGKFQGFTPLTGSGKNPERGKVMYVPALAKMRGIALAAKLLADNGQYVLGLVPEGKKAERAADSHALFKAAVADCAAATGEAAVQAVQAFLAHLDSEQVALDAQATGIAAEHNMTFRVSLASGSVIPIELPSVKAWWADRLAQETDSREGTCLVTGRAGRVVERLPQPIKGIPGGQVTGMPLVSMNAEAFESYGLPASYNAPISLDAAERCGKTLNWLLSKDDQRLRIGPLAYVFWTRDADDTGFLSCFDKPDPELVKELLNAARSGKAHAAAVVDENVFYAAGLSASGSRVVVRDWLETTVPIAKRNLARWFRCQELCDPYGQAAQPLGIYPLAAALYRDANKELVANVPQALLHCALHGGALPDFLAAQAIRRCIAEQGFSDRYAASRARLIKLWLASRPDAGEFITQEKNMSELDSTITKPAYLCGRLLSVLEAAQRAALGKVNATLVDRFYGTASSAPASVFGTLLKEAQAHLSKLRKNRPGVHGALTRRLEEIMAPLESGFPRTLTLKDQALFALGYYHQRAADRAQAMARGAELKELDPDTDTTTEETN